MKSFFRFFAERHILAYLFTIMIILLGLSTMMSIKRDSYPNVDYGVMNITTTYPGASPEDVELNVTNKIEEELKEVTGIDRYTSFSMENASVIEVVLEVDASNQDKIKTEIREAVNRVTNLPPEVTESPLVKEIKISLIPIIEIGLSGPLPYRELREHANIFEKKLKAVNGVSRVDRFGYRDREIKIEVSRDAIKDYHVPMREIIAAIQGRNIRGTSGSFESYTSEKNLVTLAQFENPMEVGDVIVRSTFEGPSVKVKDLAIIKDDFEEERVLSRMQGRPTISFNIYKNESADVIRLSDSLKKLVSKEEKNLLRGVEIIYANDFSHYVKNRFDVVINNGIIGLVLVVLCLTLFLNIRTGFWVSMGIPVAIFGTIFLLPLFDVYLDSITLTGMLLVIGIIVDDAIIIAENIMHRKAMGDSPLDAAVNGVHEVYRPVITTILTTFLVFAPMFFMTGVFGKFVFVIPLTISLALFISLTEAMIALPAHLVSKKEFSDKKSIRRRWFNKMRDSYKIIIARLLKFRYVLVPIFVILLVGSLIFAKYFMKFVLVPSEMADRFYVFTELPTGTTLEATSDKVKKIEKIVAALPEKELKSYITRIGINFVTEFVSAESQNFAAMIVDLTPYSERDRNADEIVEEIRKKTDKFADFKKIFYRIETGGPPAGKPINIKIVGSDDVMRTKLADSVYNFLASVKGVKDLDRDDKRGKDQVEIKLNYDKLSRLGLTVADVAQNVRIAYDGEVVTSVRYGDEDVDFRVMVEEKARKKLGYLKDLLIPNQQGRLIPLKNVASLGIGPGPSNYLHYNGERTIAIVADADKEIVTPLEATEAVYNNFNLDKDWPGMRFIKAGEVMQTEESMASLFRTLIIALIGIYFLLVLLFNSMTQPLLVMIAIPFGITGVIIAFAFHGESFGFMSMMGIIGLSGVVVNDSLVLVNHVNDLRKQKPDESLLNIVSEGTSDRLRAIVMTTLTTVAALLPLAYGLGGTDAWMAPMALALGWGLFFATPLTLVLVPCLYMIGKDINVINIFRRKK